MMIRSMSVKFHGQAAGFHSSEVKHVEGCNYAGLYFLACLVLHSDASQDASLISEWWTCRLLDLWRGRLSRN
jgi:hypothetical protein